MPVELNINGPNNEISINTTENRVVIVDANLPNTIEVTQPITNVVEVFSGPIGPRGDIPTSGSFNFTGSFSVSGSVVVTGSLNITGGVTGSLLGTASNAVSSSFSSTASYVNPLNQHVIITGSLTVSGSNTFKNIGPAQFTGSVDVSGSLSITGSITATSFTGSLLGTASNAVSSSFSSTASYVNPLNQTVIITGSLAASSSITAATFIGPLQGTSSWASNALTASFVQNAVSASSALTSNSASFASTASYVVQAVSASYALTASYAGDYVPYTGATSAVNLGDFNLTVYGLTVGKGNANAPTNTAVGVKALSSSVTFGYYNTAVGYNVLKFNTGGTYNTAVGTDAMGANTQGYNNAALGVAALSSNSVGVANVAIGYSALVSNTSGSANTAIGHRAGYYQTSGSNNIFIGYDSSGSNVSESNRTWIGNGSTTSTWVGGNLLLGTTTDDGINKLQVEGSVRISSSIFQTAGTFFPYAIDWFSSSIQQDTGSYILTTPDLGLTTYATYADVAAELNQYIVAVSASYALTASYSNTSTSASYALRSTSASYALTASYSNTSTSASYSNTSTSSSYALTASYSNTSTSSSYALVSTSASYSNTSTSSSYALTASYSNTSTSSSYALTASYSNTSTSASYALTSTSSSYAQTASLAPLYLPLTGGTINGNVTVNGTASVTFLNVTYESASVIYSSGSNQFGDAPNDTQTLYGRVHIPTGSLSVTGSVNITGSAFNWNGSPIVTTDNVSPKPNHFAFFNSDNSITTASIHQSGSFSVIINQENNTTSDPEALFVWQPHPTSFNVVSGKANVNNYIQLNIHNLNAGTSASSDLVATADNGSEFDNYIDMGINGGSYIDSGVGIGGINDAYLYSTGVDLIIGNLTSGNDIKFFNDDPSIFPLIIDSSASIVVNGTAKITGSLIVTGSTISTGGFTGSLQGTSSWASNAITSSYSVSASYSDNATSASYALNGGVTRLIAGPGVSLAPTNGLGQVTISSTGGGTGSFNTATGSYGSFFDTTTQTNVAGTAMSMSLNTTDITNGVSISGSVSPYNTYIKMENDGVYDIQFSAQLTKTDAGTDNVFIWLRKNGVDVADSGGDVALEGNNAAQIAAWNYFVIAAAGDYFQLMWNSPDPNVEIEAFPAAGLVPGIPSLIVTVDRINNFLSNTGSFTGSFTGQLIGTSSWASNAISSSYATTSSYALTAQTLLGSVVSASFASTASYVQLAQTSSLALTAVTASYALTAQTLLGTVTSASYALTASNATSFTISNTLAINGTLTDSAVVSSTIVGDNNLFTKATGSLTSAFGKYTLFKDANARSGEFMTVWNGTTTSYTDTSVADIGSTTDITFTSEIVGSDVLIDAVAASSGWTVKMLITYI